MTCVVTAGWSELPYDLSSLIGSKLELEADRISFRSVCKWWRSSLGNPFPQPPWLILSESCKDDEEVNPPPPRGFVGLGAMENVYHLHLPEVHKLILFGSTGTWLVTGTNSIRCKIRLLNPFSRVQFDLPIMIHVPFPRPECKIIISAGPLSGKDCIAMAIIDDCMKTLAIARPGDASWTTLTTRISPVTDIIFYKERFYAVDMHAKVYVCDIGEDLRCTKASFLARFDIIPRHKDCEKLDPRMLDRFPCHGPDMLRRRGTPYLVEWLGELLIVIRLTVTEFDPDKDDMLEFKNYKTEKFEVYKLDIAKKVVEKLNSLGEHALFLGLNNSVSLLARNYTGVKANCIYFTSSARLLKKSDMGVFDLEDGSIQLWRDNRYTSKFFFLRPIWIIPTPPSVK